MHDTDEQRIRDQFIGLGHALLQGFAFFVCGIILASLCEQFWRGTRRHRVAFVIAPTSARDSGEPLPKIEMRAFEVDRIRRVLVRTEGKVSGEGGATEFLGIKPTTLNSRMKKFGIEKLLSCRVLQF